MEIINRLYNEGWATGNLDVALAQLHPDIVWTAMESAPDAGTRRGHDEARAYMQDWTDDFDMESGMLTDPVERGDSVVCTHRGAATGKGSGLRTEIVYCAFYAFDGDKIVRIHEYATREEADAALESQVA